MTAKCLDTSLIDPIARKALLAVFQMWKELGSVGNELSISLPGEDENGEYQTFCPSKESIQRWSKAVTKACAIARELYEVDPEVQELAANLLGCDCNCPEHIYAGPCPVRNPCPGWCCDDQACTCVRQTDKPDAAPVPLCICGCARMFHIGERFSCDNCVDGSDETLADPVQCQEYVPVNSCFSATQEKIPPASGAEGVT